MTLLSTIYWPKTLSSQLWSEENNVGVYDERNYEVTENPDHFMLSLDMPGFKKEDIHISMVDKDLEISGERKKENGLRQFKRSFTMPKSVEIDNIQARYEDGVLDIYLPKAASAQARRIEITGHKSGGFFERLMGSSKKAPEKDVTDSKVSS